MTCSMPPACAPHRPRPAYDTERASAEIDPMEPREPMGRVSPETAVAWPARALWIGRLARETLVSRD